jgi:hypothetical protein
MTVVNLAIRILIAVGGIVAAVSRPVVQADADSELFNAEVAQVQQSPIKHVR